MLLAWGHFAAGITAMTTKDAILYNLRFSGGMLDMLTADLSRQDLNHRVVPESNAAAWTLGHLILTERSLLKRLGVGEDQMPGLPSPDFAARYARDESAPRASSYPEAQELAGLFKEHRAALVDAVKASDEALLDQPLDPPTRIARTLGELILFMGLHVAMHAGQVSTIRRTLGRPPVV